VQLCPSQGEPLLHALAPGTDDVVATLPEVPAREQLSRANIEPVILHAARPCVERQVLERREFLVEARLIEQDANALADVDGIVGRIVAKNGSRNACRLHEAEQKVEGRRLAGSVRSDEAEDRSGGNRQAQCVQRPQAREVLR